MVKNIYKNMFAVPSLTSSICVWTQFIKILIFLLIALVPGKNSLFFINLCFVRLFHLSLILKFLSQGIIYRLLPTLLWRQIDLVVFRSKGISRLCFWIEKCLQHKDSILTDHLKVTKVRATKKYSVSDSYPCETETYAFMSVTIKSNKNV